MCTIVTSRWSVITGFWPGKALL